MAEETAIHAFAFDVFVLEVYPFNEAQSYTLRRLFILRPGGHKEEVMVPSKRTGKERPPNASTLKLLAYLAKRRLTNPKEKGFKRSTIVDGNWGTGAVISPNALDKAIGEVRVALKESRETIVEPIPGYGYRFIPSVRDLMAEITTENDSGEPFEVRYLKNDEEGARRLQHCFQSPRLKRVFNTYFRFEQHSGEYRPSTVDVLIESVTSFVERSMGIDGRPCVFEVLGGFPEIPYLDKLIDLAGSDKRHEQKFVFHWLHENTPMMNFIILEYAGQNQQAPEFEVLFGWGGHSASSTEAVFQSTRQELVDQFRELYDLLLSSAVSQRMELPAVRQRLESLKGAPAKVSTEPTENKAMAGSPSMPSRRGRRKFKA